MKRYKNGRYKSKRDYEIECKTRNYTIMFIFTTALLLGVNLQPWTATYYNPLYYTANAQEIVQEEEPASTEPVAPVYSDKVQQAIDEIPHETEETERRISYLYDYAEGKNVDPDLVARTIYCESMWNCVQSGIVKNGKQEESYCLAQIHAPSHPELTMEQLQDPYFNIRYIVDNFYNDVWYGYDRKTDTCSSGVPEYWK